MLGQFDSYALGLLNKEAPSLDFETAFTDSVFFPYYRKIENLFLDRNGLVAQVFQTAVVAEHMSTEEPTDENAPKPPFGCVLCGRMNRIVPKSGIQVFQFGINHISPEHPPMTEGIRFVCCNGHACYIQTVYNLAHFLDHFKKMIHSHVAKAETFDILVGPSFAKKPLDKWKGTTKNKEVPPIVDIFYKFRRFLEKILEALQPTTTTTPHTQEQEK